MFGAPASRKPLTWMTEHLAVGAAPLSWRHIELLREEGIDAILNLCGEFTDLHDIESREGFEVYWMPVEDEEAPELKELEKALDWLDECVYLGKKVLIHCRHGIGRTGTVLNAYLLRRGLGHRRAAAMLRRLRTGPSNFTQWRAVRRYGKASPRLTVREPSLETRHLVDLTPFLDDFDAVIARAEDLVSIEAGGRPRCGREHDRCAGTPIALSLVEAVGLRMAVDRHLPRESRVEVIDRAVEASRRERAAREQSGDESCLFDAGSTCPLSDGSACLVFENRPLQCRTFELPEDIKTDLWENVLAPSLDRLSEELLFSFTASPVTGEPPLFSLADVVSGKYVQRFFHFLMESGGNGKSLRR